MHPLPFYTPLPFAVKMPMPATFPLPVSPITRTGHDMSPSPFRVIPNGSNVNGLEPESENNSDYSTGSNGVDSWSWGEDRPQFLEPPPPLRRVVGRYGRTQFGVCVLRLARMLYQRYRDVLVAMLDMTSPVQSEFYGSGPQTPGGTFVSVMLQPALYAGNNLVSAEGLNDAIWRFNMMGVSVDHALNDLMEFVDHVVRKVYGEFLDQKPPLVAGDGSGRSPEYYRYYFGNELQYDEETKNWFTPENLFPGKLVDMVEHCDRVIRNVSDDGDVTETVADICSKLKSELVRYSRGEGCSAADPASTPMSWSYLFLGNRGDVASPRDLSMLADFDPRLGADDGDDDDDGDDVDEDYDCDCEDSSESDFTDEGGRRTRPAPDYTPGARTPASMRRASRRVRFDTSVGASRRSVDVTSALSLLQLVDPLVDKENAGDA